mgnify:CR=1 FL=1
MRKIWNTHITKIANSIAETSIIGSDIDLSTNRIITNIATIDTALTVLKSLSVIVIRSLVQGASPTTIALES